MKLNKKLILSAAASLTLLISSANAASEQSITYKNQRGSVMKLTFHPGKNVTGILTGTFTTAVGDCKTDVGVPMPLTGFFNGNAVSIAVNFPECKSLVAMTGNLTDNNSKLETLWLVAQDVKDDVHSNWNSNLVGNDSFKKIN